MPDTGSTMDFPETGTYDEQLERENKAIVYSGFGEFLFRRKMVSRLGVSRADIVCSMAKDWFLRPLNPLFWRPMPNLPTSLDLTGSPSEGRHTYGRRERLAGTC